MPADHAFGRLQAAQAVRKASQGEGLVVALAEDADDAGDALAGALVYQGQAHLDRVLGLLRRGTEKQGQGEDQDRCCLQ